MDKIINKINHELLVEEIKKLIETKKVREIRELQEEITYPNFALVMGDEALNDEERLYLLRVLRTTEAAEIFSYLEDEIKTRLVTLFSDELGKKVLQELETAELVDILEELPVNIMRKVLSQTPKEKRDIINQILLYKDNQVGSIMQVDISILKNSWTGKEALTKIKKDYHNNMTMGHNFYIVDHDGKLLGDITLEEIIFNAEGDLLDNWLNPVTAVYPTDDKEQAAKVFSDNDRSSLPVVSLDNRLIGMISSDAIIDVIHEEATEDMYKMVGISSEVSEENYLKTTIKTIVKSRVLWLIILMLSATLSQYIIQKFTNISEESINQFGITVSTAVIVSLIPIISGSAGNAGSQSTTTVTRAAALGEFHNSQYKKVIAKELLVGTIIGGIMFAINLIRLYIYYAIPTFRNDAFHDGKSDWISLSFIILASSLSLWFVVIFAKFLGTIIPLVAIRFKKDPAVMSAPILTTLSDALSTLIFFGLNILVLYIAWRAGLFDKTPIVSNKNIVLELQNFKTLTNLNLTYFN
ncbi:magnesium transporter [Mycoplasmopsis bovirhinis]|uniref:Magnesium transporter MgtE n=1 Tax=Mycoplasmopsis bovirhinis TaxID=29553 RepID=A0A224AZA0_9BACT|nr:magnesium transporter [Mycoplasmopsis bovirhinis]BBA22642.1 magnesium transporter [Mycoplasmopsis bovirhinis]VEU63624.1 Magnesium transporter mgtE [Mycoplasmopsis bovirhinis]